MRFSQALFMRAGEQIESNKEHGLGRPDLVIIDKVNGKVANFRSKIFAKHETVK